LPCKGAPTSVKFPVCFELLRSAQTQQHQRVMPGSSRFRPLRRIKFRLIYAEKAWGELLDALRTAAAEPGYLAPDISAPLPDTAEAEPQQSSA
jgi:hypothetical protein